MNQHTLKELFEYIDGDLFYKKSTALRIKVGNKVGWKNGSGYLQAKVDGKTYLVHRIIFLMHHGYLPKYIDHIDTNPLNNKIENLRPATVLQNNQNVKTRKDNTSGIKGIDYRKNTNKWRARIKIAGVTKNLGEYNDIEYAKFILEAVRHKYHGNFANNGKDTT
jgi:alkyl hydroperoxide reductase subunit AhpF